MRFLRKIAAALGLALTFAAPVAEAGVTTTQLVQPGIVAPRAWHGPGSPGMLPTCSGTFQVQNVLYQSNSIGSVGAFTSPWVASSATFIASGVADPDGGNNAFTVQIPTTGAGGFAFLRQTNASIIALYAYQFDAQIRVHTPAAGKVYAFWAASGTSVFNGTKEIPADGQYHWVHVLAPGGTYGSPPSIVIGINTNDPKQMPSTGPIQVDIYHASVTGGRGPGGQQWPIAYSLIDTSGTSAASATRTLTNVPCPPGVAFRDFTALTPYQGNPHPTWSSSNLEQAGGISGPYFLSPDKDGIQNPSQYQGGYFYELVNATDGTHHSDYFSFDLYKCSTPLNCTYVPGVNPVIQVPGSTISAGSATAPTVSANQIAGYMLHPILIPCTISATFHQYCAIFSGQDNASGTGNSNLFAAYADNVTGPYTWYNGNSLFFAGGSPSTTTKPGLPATLKWYDQESRTCYQYMFLSTNGNNSVRTNAYRSLCGTSGPSDWVFFHTALFDKQSYDWDATNFAGRIDSHVRYSCNGLEYYYTAYWSTNTHGGNRGQGIGYAVSDDPRGPWFLYQGPIIPYTSPMYGSTPYIGDTAIFSKDGTFYWVGNYDSLAGPSQAQVATMRDACASTAP